MSYAWQQPYPMRTTAPISLHIVAIFQYLGGLLTLALGAVLALAAFDLFPRLDLQTAGGAWTTRPADITPVVAAICAVFGLVGLFAIVLGRKLQRGRNWARVLLTVLNLLSVAAGVWQGYTSGLPYGETLLSIALPLIFVFLLNTRAARSWCHYQTY